MNLNYVLWLIDQNDTKTTRERSGKRRNTPDVKEQARLRPLDATTSAESTVSRSTFLSHGTNLLPRKASAHDYQRHGNTEQEGFSRRRIKSCHSRQKYWVLLQPPIGVCKWWQNSTCGVHCIHDRYVQKECKSKLCNMSSSAPTSIQTCRWWHNSNSCVGSVCS